MAPADELEKRRQTWKQAALAYEAIFWHSAKSISVGTGLDQEMYSVIRAALVYGAILGLALSSLGSLHLQKPPLLNF